MCSLSTVAAVASQGIKTEGRLMTRVGLLFTLVNIRAGSCFVQRIVVAFVAFFTGAVEPAYPVHTH